MCQSAGAVTRFKGGGRVKPGDILSERDMITERHQRPEVDDVLQVSAELTAEYGQDVLLDGFAIAEMKPGETAIAYYDGSKIAMNDAYFDAEKMKTAWFTAFLLTPFHTFLKTKQLWLIKPRTYVYKMKFSLRELLK